MLILSIIVCALESGEITNGNEKKEKDPILPAHRA